jgi:hypothetical protein
MEVKAFGANLCGASSRCKRAGGPFFAGAAGRAARNGTSPAIAKRPGAFRPQALFARYAYGPRNLRGGDRYFFRIASNERAT